MEALKMRAEGIPYAIIQAELGYPTPQAVWKATSDMLKRNERDTADEYRRLQSERLDIALNAVWEKVKMGDEKAIDVFLRIEDRRSKLFGLDAKPAAGGGSGGGMQINVLVNGVSPTHGSLPDPSVITVIPTSVPFDEDDEDEMEIVSSD